MVTNVMQVPNLPPTVDFDKKKPEPLTHFAIYTAGIAIGHETRATSCVQITRQNGSLLRYLEPLECSLRTYPLHSTLMRAQARSINRVSYITRPN